MGSTRLLFLCLATTLVVFSVNLDVSEATEFVVGGKQNSWSTNAPNELNAWAEKERFKVGDSLVFKYDAKVDSVLQVEEGDYKKCIKTKPINEYHDGNTLIKLNESGAFYFISGANGHCEKGQKLVIRVLSQKHSSTAPAPSLPPTTTPSAASPPPVFTPAEAPKDSSVGSSDFAISTMVMTTLVAAAAAMI
uniref:early nodulin-like protein 1 n=1 Tax=Erigeron canadensis TaxID=72917 RepID=UPI001CB98779|nr:early nodulin-like protein 1 [Erigeron canadensis]